MPARQEALGPEQRALTDRTESLLIEDETILAVAAENPLPRLWMLPSDGVVVTDVRILFLDRGVFGFSFEDFYWKLVEDIHFASHFTGAHIRVRAVESSTGYASDAMRGKRIEYQKNRLVEQQAQTVYSVGQKLEKQWRERRREQIMEEQQAERGRVVETADAPPAGTDGGPDDEFERRIEKLKQMHDKDLLTDEEFEAKKQEILNSI